MGVLFKNENLTEDMIDILQHFQTCLDTVTIQGGKKFASQICTGDQLSVERAVNAIHSVSNGHTAEDRLTGFTIQLGDWQTGFKILEVKNVCFKKCRNYYHSEWLTTKDRMLVTFYLQRLCLTCPNSEIYPKLHLHLSSLHYSQ